MLRRFASNRKSWLKIIPILLLLFIISCCSSVIIGRFYTPQERICDNLANAGVLNRENCALTGKPRDYLPVYFRKGEADIHYVKTGMEGFRLISESKGPRSTQFYILERSILGIPIYEVEFIFDDGLLFEILISN